MHRLRAVGQSEVEAFPHPASDRARAERIRGRREGPADVRVPRRIPIDQLFIPASSAVARIAATRRLESVTDNGGNHRRRQEQSGPADPARTNVNEDYELRYWTAKLGCTTTELKAAVAAVGVMACGDLVTLSNVPALAPCDARAAVARGHLRHPLPGSRRRSRPTAMPRRLPNHPRSLDEGPAPRAAPLLVEQVYKLL